MADGAGTLRQTTAERLLAHPVRVLAPLLALVLGIELAQAIPEIFPGGHALGEVVRNLAYALIGAVIFHWLIVEIPEQRRRRASYEFHQLTFETLLSAGPGLLFAYQLLSDVTGKAPLDVWDQDSVHARAKALAVEQPATMFGPHRTGLITTVVEIAVPRALTELSASSSYFHPNVSYALGTFPRHDGLRILQIERGPDGGIMWHRDVHITWELLEAARRLYAALRDTGAYVEIPLGQMGSEPGVPLSHDVLHKDEGRK